MNNFEHEQRSERERRGMDDWSANQIKYTGTFNTVTPPNLTPEQQIMNAEQRIMVQMNNKVNEVQTTSIRNIDRIDTQISTMQAQVDVRAVTADIQMRDIISKTDKTAETVDAHTETLTYMREGFQELRDQMLEMQRVNEALRRQKDALERENENLREQNFEYIEENEGLQDDLGTAADKLKETREKLDETTQKLRDATHTGEGLRTPQQEMYDDWMKKLGIPPAHAPGAGRIMYTTTTNRTSARVPVAPKASDDPVQSRVESKAAMFASIYGGNPFRNRGAAR